MYDKTYIKFVQEFLERSEEVRKVVDIGCGDAVSSCQIDWGDREYVGIDIVRKIIEKNQKKTRSDTVFFVHLDVLTGELPDGDLAICKDFFVHLPNAAIFDFLPRLAKFKYVIFVNDVPPYSRALAPIDITMRNGLGSWEARVKQKQHNSVFIMAKMIKKIRWWAMNFLFRCAHEKTDQSKAVLRISLLQRVEKQRDAFFIAPIGNG